MRVEYDSNNSGGDWWLSDEDWKALEAAGWIVRWVANDEFYTKYASLDANGRWLGALAKSAVREGLSERDAIEEWERITGQDSEAEGCSCCGRPHYFYVREEAEV